jgi:hypothetical protein
MNLLFDLITAFLILGFAEAVVKPIAKRFVQRKILKYSPIVLEAIDKQMPQLLGAYDGKELEQVVKTKLEGLTGESWNQDELEEVFKIFDIRITADRTKS